ncbi:NIPSNAP family protein [Rhodoferax sp.]|uniref:NIPSNAP family protein n=1 Tax=Rhodoferax sp. TaxID=50421 RepID=UPI00374D6F25
MHELRIYTSMPGRMPDLLRRFETAVMPIWARHGIAQAGFWTDAADPASLDLRYLIRWESMAEREIKWNAFLQDPQWQAAFAASESQGKLVARASSIFLQPTVFSAVQ